MNRSSKRLIPDGAPHARSHTLEGGGVRITTFVPCHFKKRGLKKVIVAPVGESHPVTVTDSLVIAPDQDQPLVKALGRGIYWQHLLESGAVATTAELADREGVHRSTINEFLRLALLAPDLVQAAYDGKLPRTVSLEAILRAKIPFDWKRQREMIASLG